MRQKVWEKLFEDTKALRDEAQKRLKELELALSIAEGRVREASRWKLHEDNWSDPTIVSWKELMAYAPRQTSAGKKKVTMDIRIDRVTWRTGRRNQDVLAYAIRIVEKKESESNE